MSRGGLNDPFMSFFSQIPCLSLGNRLGQRCSLLFSLGVTRSRGDSGDRSTLRKMLIDDINAMEWRRISRIALAFA